MASGSKLSILVIDDHESLVKYLKMHLEMCGFEVQVAQEGAVGIEIARSFPPTAVLCDITLPDMDGFAVAAALKQIPALAHTRLIAISGFDLSPEPEKLAKAGFEKSLMKPFDADELQQLLLDLTASEGQPPPYPAPGGGG